MHMVDGSYALELVSRARPSHTKKKRKGHVLYYAHTSGTYEMILNFLFITNRKLCVCDYTERCIEKNYGESIVPKSSSCSWQLTQAIFPLSRCLGVVLFEPIP